MDSRARAGRGLGSGGCSTSPTSDSVPSSSPSGMPCPPPPPPPPPPLLGFTPPPATAAAAATSLFHFSECQPCGDAFRSPALQAATSGWQDQRPDKRDERCRLTADDNPLQTIDTGQPVGCGRRGLDSGAHLTGAPSPRLSWRHGTGLSLEKSCFRVRRYQATFGTNVYKDKTGFTEPVLLPE